MTIHSRLRRLRIFAAAIVSVSALGVVVASASSQAAPGVLGPPLLARAPASVQAAVGNPMQAKTQEQFQSLFQTMLAAGQTGYDGHLCNIDSLWIRQSPSDSGTRVAQVFRGDPMHVYATHNSVPSIPVGWALGYGRPHGGQAADGYFKYVPYVCTP
jgi:hypothetical protein